MACPNVTLELWLVLIERDNTWGMGEKEEKARLPMWWWGQDRPSLGDNNVQNKIIYISGSQPF